MKMALIAKNKLSFVNGTLPKPDDSSDDSYAWYRCNNMLLSWILNSVSKEIAASIIYIDTAADMWNDLKDRFSQRNGPRIYEIQKSISALSQDNLSVSSYFTALKGLWDELNNYLPLPSCPCGSMKIVVDYREQEYVFQFLMGLNETFSHVRAQILLIDPLPSINKVFSLVIQEERQRQVISSAGSMNHHNSAAMITTASQHSSQGYKPNTARKEKPRCSHCGILGHTVDKCYKVHGYPPGFKFTKGKTTSSAHQVSEIDVPHLPFSQEQYEQILALIKPKSYNDQPSVQNITTQDHLFADMAGSVSFFILYFKLLNIQFLVLHHL
jgi:hypothetical protein